MHVEKLERQIIKSKKDYPTQRTCGVWLMYIGVIISVSVLTGGELFIHPIIFGVGYAVGFITILLLPYVNRWLAYGKNSRFQETMDNVATGVNIVLCTLCGIVIGFDDLRLLWLCILFVVGIHFFGFYFSQGKWVVFLGLLSIVNVSIGLIFQEVPFLAIGLIDGFFKFGIGLRMFLLKSYVIRCC